MQNNQQGQNQQGQQNNRQNQQGQPGQPGRQNQNNPQGQQAQPNFNSQQGGGLPRQNSGKVEDVVRSEGLASEQNFGQGGRDDKRLNEEPYENRTPHHYDEKAITKDRQ